MSNRWEKKQRKHKASRARKTMSDSLKMSAQKLTANKVGRTQLLDKINYWVQNPTVGRQLGHPFIGFLLGENSKYWLLAQQLGTKPNNWVVFGFPGYWVYANLAAKLPQIPTAFCWRKLADARNLAWRFFAGPEGSKRHFSFFEKSKTLPPRTYSGVQPTPTLDTQGLITADAWSSKDFTTATAINRLWHLLLYASRWNTNKAESYS